MSSSRQRWWTPSAVVLITLCVASPLRAQFVSDAEKSDSLRLRNGDWVVGDLREMERGMVTYKTDAMSTIYVKWPRVLTATTNKRFEIHLDDERRYLGSLQASETLGRVVIRADRDTFEVATQSIFELKRIKPNFWDRLDGSLDFGFDFQQQNAKTDLSLQSETRYLFNRNRLNLGLDGSFSRQDSVADITRGTAQLSYARELQGLWFVGFSASAEQNSQLSLDIRGSIGGGPGRIFIANNKMELAALLGIAYSRERFTSEEARNTVPLGLITDVQFFNWSGLSTDLSSRLSIQPVLNDSGRWRISFSIDLTQEILNLLYLTVGLNEEYDSKPPSADANKNDFRITTSLGWTY
jgi:hypothetical protein